MLVTIGLRVFLWAIVLSIPAGTASAQGWFDDAWRFRKSVTIHRTEVAGVLSNFPVLISEVDADLSAKALANGFDIVFTAADGTTQLDHEIEAYTSSTGSLDAWVNVPAVTPAADTVLYMYYGNPGSSDQQSPAAVWDSNYQGVWHLHDDLDDSTLPPQNGTNQSTTNLNPGQIADARNFSGSSQWIDLPSTCFVTIPFTLEFWINPSSASNYQRVFSQGDTACGSRQLTAYWRSTRIEGYTATDGSNGSGQVGTAQVINNGVWAHVAWTFDGATHAMYVNGQPSASSPTGSNLNVTGPNYIGRRVAGSYWQGGIDELRISNTLRSPAWFETQFNSQNSPSTFYTLGPEQFLAAIVKRAFQSDGTPIPDGASLPGGMEVKFLLYINNVSGPMVDVSLQDVLDPTFGFVANSIRYDTTVPSCSAIDCTPVEEDAIFAAADSGLVGTDAPDGDPVSVVGATLNIGNENATNGQLDIPANSIWSVLFTIRMQ